MNILYLFPWLLVVGAWSTVYSFEQGRIYVHLKNNDLVALNFSATGLDTLSTYSLEEVNYRSGQHIQALAPPPVNSSLFAWKEGLYAFTGAKDKSLAEYDRCGNGIFQLLRYHADKDAWVHEPNMTFAQIDDISYYADSTYLTSVDSDTIYIYGGRCEGSDEISGRLLSFNMQDRHFANISTSTKPQAFYGAGTVWAPTPHSTFVIGGRSTQGWLNMGQIAVWDFQAGWTSQQTTNSSGIESRTGGLALPVFNPLTSASESSVQTEYSVSEIVVVGGEALGGPAHWAHLKYTQNSWIWSSYPEPALGDDILGAAVIFNTLVVVKDSSQKRDSTYQLDVYSVQEFQQKSDLLSSEAAQTKKPAEKEFGKTTKVLVGTLVPLLALASAVAVGFYSWKRRKMAQDSHSLVEPLEYQFGHFKSESDASSLLQEKPLGFSHINDSTSTLDVGSLDSWVRKRQEYEANLPNREREGSGLVTANATVPNSERESTQDPFNQRVLQRISYLASNETLHSNISQEDLEGYGGTAYSPLVKKKETTFENVNLGATEILEQHKKSESERDLGDLTREKVEVPLRIAHLKKSFSYSQTPPQSPMLRKKSRLDPGFYNVLEGTTASDDESIDENVDVQVLVSSKRKSVLRVANPDEESDSETAESLRQRVSSR